MFTKEKYEKIFAEVAATFPFPGYMGSYCYYQLKTVLFELNRLLPELKNKKLLDVGSGPMDKTAVFQRLGYDCYAADDLSDPWHKVSGNREKILSFADASGIKFHLHTDGTYTIPFAKNHFDIVTSFAVIEHLHESPRLILNSMGEHLKENGLLVIVMPNSVNLRKRLSVVFGRSNYNPIGEMFYSIGEYRGHVREYTLSEARYICEEAGFKILRCRTFEHLAYEKLPFGLRHIYILLGMLVPGFRSGLLVIAQKPEDWVPLNENPEIYFQEIAGANPCRLT